METPENLHDEISLFYEQMVQKRKFMAAPADIGFQSDVSEQVRRLPVPVLKGSLEGIEQAHGAYLAIKMSADCRNMIS